MHSFTDADGQKWTFDLLRPDFLRIKAELEIDLLNLHEDRLLERLANEETLIVDVISVVLTDQIRERYAALKATEQQEPIERWFARKLVGDVITAASDALLAEIFHFFPTRKRTAFAAALKKAKELTGLQTERMLTLLETGKFDQKVRQALDRFEQELLAD